MYRMEDVEYQLFTSRARKATKCQFWSVEWTATASKHFAIKLGNPGREYIVAVIAATAIADNFQTPASFDLLSYDSHEDFSRSDPVIDILVPRWDVTC